MAAPTPLLSVLEEEVARADFPALEGNRTPEQLIRRWAAAKAAEDFFETMKLRDVIDAIESGDALIDDLSDRDSLNQWLDLEFEMAADDHGAENDQTREQVLDGGFQTDWLVERAAAVVKFWTD